MGVLDIIEYDTDFPKSVSTKLAGTQNYTHKVIQLSYGHNPYKGEDNTRVYNIAV